MNNISINSLIIFYLVSFSASVVAASINDLPRDEELFLDSSDARLLSELLVKDKKSQVKEKHHVPDAPLNKQLRSQDKALQKKNLSTGGKTPIDVSESDFYLFEQEELDAQKPGLGIYESLSPLLSPEMKKDAKKAWVESTDFRQAIDFTRDDSESQALVLKKTAIEMTALKGITLEELASKNLPPGVADKKDPDKAMIRALFDDFYELIKNALLLVAGILIAAKLLNFIVKKIIKNAEKQKKRRSRSRRRKRRRHHARFKTG